MQSIPVFFDKAKFAGFRRKKTDVSKLKMCLTRFLSFLGLL